MPAECYSTLFPVSLFYDTRPANYDMNMLKGALWTRASSNQIESRRPFCSFYKEILCAFMDGNALTNWDLRFQELIFLVKGSKYVMSCLP